MTIEELLITAKENKASDVHITVGLPPKMRINGILVDMDYPRLLPPDTEAVISTMMSASRACSAKLHPKRRMLNLAFLHTRQASSNRILR